MKDILELKGVGEKTAKHLRKLKINYIEDLYTYFPRNYDALKEPVLIKDIKEGEINSLLCRLKKMPVTKKIKNLYISSCTFYDESGAIEGIYFNMPFIGKTMKIGMDYVVRGFVRNKGGKFKIEHPKLYLPNDYDELKETLLPVYHLTEGISNVFLTKCIKQAFSMEDLFEKQWGEDILPDDLLAKEQLLCERECIKTLHFPYDDRTLQKARESMVFREFFVFTLRLSVMKKLNKQKKMGFVIEESVYTRRLIESLPYRLTDAQSRAFLDILEDLGSTRQMNRLIQGDVGSGKTIVAMLACITCIANGYQCIFMAPTEVLAKQHMTFARELAEQYHMPIKPILLTGSTKDKKEIYEKIENGTVNLVIGTHAVFQEKVKYQNLGLVVTDEQHRFGVNQREQVVNKGNKPHILVMSATPIPRSLAIILYGDLDVSVMNELPKQRIPIKNCVVSEKYRKKTYELMLSEIEMGHQVYVICPMTDAQENDMGLENVTDYAKKLRSVMPEKIQISHIHGKMKPEQKEKIMQDFSDRQIDILVSTTVIEVGIDVPNATVMLIEDADRFGLATLHQLRGRVGRGKEQSYCIFMSRTDNQKTLERLEILKKSNDGFFIANEDLRLRGAGDLFGIRQSGECEFVLGNIYEDAEILKKAAALSEEICSQNYSLACEILKKAQKNIYFEDKSHII